MIDFEGRQIPTELHEIVDPRRAVLLVWDMQNDQAGGSFNKEALIRNAPPLIDAAAISGGAVRISASLLNEPPA